MPPTLSSKITAPESHARGAISSKGASRRGTAAGRRFPTAHRGHPYPVAYPGHHDREGDRAGVRSVVAVESNKPPSIHNRPAARQSQPTAFLGRLEAIRAPTSGKAKKRAPPTNFQHRDQPPSGWEGRRFERGTTVE